MPTFRPHHYLAAVILYGMFSGGVDPKLIALVAGLLYLDERRAPSRRGQRAVDRPPTRPSLGPGPPVRHSPAP